MDGAIFVLSRKVRGDDAEEFTQTVTVFADSPSQARGIVERDFAMIRRGGSNRRAYGTSPAWNVDKVSLDEHKLIMAGVTT